MSGGFTFENQYSRVVAKDVDTAEMPQSRLHQFLDLNVVGDVRLHEECRASLRIDRGCRFGARRRVNFSNHNARALSRESFGDTSANTGAAARYDRNSIF